MGLPLPVLQFLFPLNEETSKPVSLGVQWESRHDWLTLVESRVRVYRLQAHLVSSYNMVVFISRIGEILKVELPGEIQLINEVFGNL